MTCSGGSVGQALGVTVEARGEGWARAVAQAFGDVAVVGWVDAEAEALVVVAACHRNPERDPDARILVGERYGRGVTLPGRVWQAERGILLIDVDTAALAAIGPEGAKLYMDRMGLRSLMLVPIWRAGRVVGVLGVGREPGHPPYTEAEFKRLEAMAVLD